MRVRILSSSDWPGNLSSGIFENVDCPSRLCHHAALRLEDGKIVEHWDNKEVMPKEAN